MSDPDILVPTDNNNGITPGRIDGAQFGVTPDGAATYTLPLWIPPGRRSIQPELTLHYHSRGGNGWLGVGWSLSGIPQITRCKKTVADDGAVGPIRFDQTDEFCLDGERLILVSGTHGVDGAEYRTKRETFTKIILHDVDSAPDGHILGPTWFEAFYKDGRIFTFGGVGAGDLGSRFEGIAEQFVPVPMPATASDEQVQNAVEVVHTLVRYAWSLSSIRDRSGNMLLIYYDGYPSAPGTPPVPRDYVPTQILYTGSPADGTAALRTVDFVWEDRPDPQTRFMSGLRLVHKKRLKELHMSGPDPVNTGLLRRYAFGYRNDSVSGRSLLSSVQEFDRFGVAKGAHSFEWEPGKLSFRQIDTGITDVKTTPIGRSTLPGRIRVADFNGDGRDDILYIPLSDANQFYILLADDSSPTGFAPPFPTGIPVPPFSPFKDTPPIAGYPYIFPDAAGDWMNILILDTSTLGFPTYRVYHAGIDRSGASGNIGSFWVFPGRPIFDVSGGRFVEGIVELADFDGDGLPDLLHGDLTHAVPSWSLRANLGGNLNFANEQFVGLFPVDHYFANLDGDTATALLLDGSALPTTAGTDPRYSVLQLQRQGTNLSTSSGLTTLLRDQQYVFADVTGSGLPSPFSLGNTNKTAPTLAENVGGSFATPIPFNLILSPPIVGFAFVPQPPDPNTPLIRVIDWDQDGSAELILRQPLPTHDIDPQRTDLIIVLKWTGSGFTLTTLPFPSFWKKPEQFNLFEVLDVNGDGLDDIIMFSGLIGDEQLRLFIREGKKADMMTAVVDGLGARTAITYAPISDQKVHTPGFGFTYPQRAVSGKVWVVAEYQDDNGIGGVNTYQFHYQGGVEDVTGEGFLGFTARDVLHVEAGVTTHMTYLPAPFGSHLYPLLGLSIDEVTHIPLSDGTEHMITRHVTYAVRMTAEKKPAICDQLAAQLSDLQSHLATLQKMIDNPKETCAGLTDDECILLIKQLNDQAGSVQRQITVVQQQQQAQGCLTPPVADKPPFFVFPQTTVEENVENKNGVPTMPVRRRTITQDMDAFGNMTQYSEVWSDGNQYSSTASFLNDPNTWLIGLLDTITEQSTVPTDLTQTRVRAYEYDAQGLLSREIIEPGAKGPSGYLPLGPQADGVKTLFRSIDRYSNGNVFRVVEEETTDPTGVKRSKTFTYDDLEHMFPTEVDDDLGHHLRATYHPGLAVSANLEDENGVQRLRQYDGFGRFRHEALPDGNDVTVHYLDASGKLRVTVERAAGPQFLSDYDVLGRVVTETIYARDDGTATVQDTEYDGFGRIVRVSRPRFAVDASVYDTFAYDTLGRPTARTGADGTGATIEYLGEWIITTDAKQHAVALKLDNLDRAILSTDRDAALVGSTPGPAGMTYEYGPFGTLKTVADIVGNRTDMTSDRLGRLIDLHDPDRGRRTYQYNAFGDLEQETKGNTQFVRYHYDAVGRLYWIQDAVDGDVQYTWDTATNGIGKVAQIAVPSIGVTNDYVYDLTGRLATKTWTIGTNTYDITMEFDAVGRLVGITYPQVGTLTPFTASYEYGNFGQLLRVVDTATQHAFWRYVSSDASGVFGQSELANTLLETAIEDPARPGVLKSIQTTNPKGCHLRNLSYGFDNNLNLVSRIDEILGTTETFEYDSLDRLHRWMWKDAVITRQIRWDYDDIGNLLLRAIEAGPGQDLVYTYNPAVAGPHAVVSTTLGAYAYDAKGNQTSAPGRTVTCGRQDLPTQVVRTVGKQLGAINLVYDGEMTRVRTIDEAKGITTVTLGGVYECRYRTGSLDGEHIFTVSVNARPIARRIWRIVRNTLVRERIEYLHADHQGSIDMVTSEAGMVIDRFKYDPFGQQVSATDPAMPLTARRSRLHEGFTGQDHLDDWELIDMKGRFYDPVLGKFLTPDPFVPSPLKPQSWNRYAYVLNNPLSRRDPTGFQDMCDFGFVSDDTTVTDSRNRTGTGDKNIGQPAPPPSPPPQLPPQPPPQPPPMNDYGQGRDGRLPTNAGIPPGNRGDANRAARNPTEDLLVRLNREQVKRYGTLNTPGVPGGPPPFRRSFGPYSISSIGGYEYLQDRGLGWVGTGLRGDVFAMLAMEALQSDPNRFFPFQVVGHNGERGIILGATYELSNRSVASPLPLPVCSALLPPLFPMPPGTFPVRVTEVTPTSFTFTTLVGHFDAPGSTITFSTRVDTAGFLHLEHLGVTTYGQSGVSYLIAPTLAGQAWDIMANNLRSWLWGAR